MNNTGFKFSSLVQLMQTIFQHKDELFESGIN